MLPERGAALSQLLFHKENSAFDAGFRYRRVELSVRVMLHTGSAPCRITLDEAACGCDAAHWQCSL